MIKKAKTTQVKSIIEESLEKGKKNILFVSHLVYDEPIKEWLDENKGRYVRVCCSPGPLYVKNSDGILVKVMVNGKEVPTIDENTIKRMNRENSIVFMDFFGKESVYGFDEFIDILKNRNYTQKDENGNTLIVYDVSKMPLFIAMSCDEDYVVPEEYYDMFDDVYILDK